MTTMTEKPPATQPGPAPGKRASWQKWIAIGLACLVAVMLTIAVTVGGGGSGHSIRTPTMNPGLSHFQKVHGW